MSEAAVERDLLAELLHGSISREKALEEEVLRLEALVRAKDETLGELLDVIDLAGFWDKADDLLWS